MKNTRSLRNTILIAALLLCAVMPASATGGLQSSTIYTGFMKLLSDVSLAATVACPVIGGIAAIIFMIRRGMADEQDGKMWTKRINTAIICGVGGMLVSGVISLLSSYFQ